MAPLFDKRRTSSLAGGGRVSSALGTFLSTHPSGGTTTRSAAEWVADIVARTTGLGIERSAHRKVRRGRNRLTRAVGAYHRHTMALERFTATERAEERSLREKKSLEHHTEDMKTRSNPAVPLISGPFLLMLEMVVIVAELAFYYYTFSGDLQEDAGWLEKAMVIVLSVLIPVLGIAAARWFGASVATVRGLSTGATTNKPSALIALAAASTLLALAATATFRLVEWRYTGQSIPGMPVAHPPERVMATVFVAVLLLDAGIRAFANPVSARSDAHLARRMRADRRGQARVVNAQSKALTKWTQAWTSLETTLNVLLDDIESALSAADIRVLTARARATELGGKDKIGGTALEPVSLEHSGIRITPRMNLPHIEVKLRILDAAFTQLHEHKPPAHLEVGTSAPICRLDDVSGDHRDVEPDLTHYRAA